jgi:tetratricopeptide (TPR) repeat protein
MRAQPLMNRAILVGMALLLLLTIRPERGLFPTDGDRLALERARENGADLTEWQLLAHFVSADPKDAESWERMGILDYHSGLCKQAVYEFEQASRYQQISTDSLVPYGECLVTLGELQAAIDLLAPRFESTKTATGLELLLAKVFLRLGDLEGASHTIQVWAEWEPDDPHTLYYVGLYQALANPVEALATLQGLAARSKDYENTYRKLQTAINKGEMQESPAYRALELGRAYGNLGEWELAFYAFNSAVQQDPGYAEAHAWFAEAKQQLGEDGSAELNKALELNPNSILAQAMEAMALQRQGDAQGALDALEHIASQEPDDPQWAIALGQARAQTGDLEGALTEYLKATTLEPENVTVWQALAEFCLTHQYQLSSVGSPAANKAVLLAPDSANSLDLAGQAALSKDELDDAEGYFRAAINQDPRYAPAHLHLALVLYQLDKDDAAFQELHKAAALGNNEALSLLTQMTTK